MDADRPADQRPGTRADIQGLRGLAVLLVVLDHASLPGLRGGYVGVDVFFVVSGFLISSLLLRDARSGRVRLGLFYARRARRILPAATVVLVATAVYAALHLSVVRIHQVVADVLWSAFFAANVHFGRIGTDYFQQDRPPSPVQHFWSLAVEEQFYLVWPVALALLVSIRGLRRWIPAVVVVALVSSFAWSVVLTRRDQVGAYFSSTTRVWELATGALLALAVSRLGRAGATTRAALSASGLIAIGWAATHYSASTPFPGWHALLPVAGTAAVVAAGTGSAQRGVGRLLCVRPVCWVGDISYSLYLWHWPVLVFARERYGTITAAQTAALVVLAVVLSAASYYLVENPIRHTRARVARGRLALGLWPVALASVVLSTQWAGMQATSVAASLARQSAAFESGYVARAADSGATSATPVPVSARVRAAVQRAAAGAPVPYPLENLGRLGRDIWQVHYTCFAEWEMTRSDVCPLGDEDATTNVVVYGDSHAGMWLPALDRLGARDHVRIVPLVKLGCSPFDVVQLHDGHSFPECGEWREWVLKRIEALHPAVVVLAYRSLLFLAPPSGTSREVAWSTGVTSALETLSKLTPEVVVLSDIPALEFDPDDCVTARNARLASCMGADDGDMRLGNELTRRAGRSTGARFVDLTDLVCAGGRCPVVVGRTILYRDSWHLTMTWVRQLTDPLGRRLRLGPVDSADSRRSAALGSGDAG